MGKGGGGGSSPADVVGAAEETGKQAQNLNEQQTWANRPNQYNAWGSTTWENAPVWDEATQQNINKWTQSETLNPQLQAQLDSQLNIGEGRAKLAEGTMSRAWENYQDPMDFGQYGDVVDFDPTQQRQTAEDSAYQRSTNRLDPQFQSQQAELETKLRNQGLSQGDQAYDAAMGNFNTGRNDAYEQARLGATSEGRDEYGLGMQGNQYANALRQQQIEEGLFKRDFDLSEVERLMGDKIKGGPPATGTSTETISGKTLGGG